MHYSINSLFTQIGLYVIIRIMEKNTGFTDVIILAGGIGERLWPASKPDCPKQFMSFSDGVSLLQSAVMRALALNPSGKIIIITKKDLLKITADTVSSLLTKLSEVEKDKVLNSLSILAEPYQRHTSAPLVLASKMLEKSDGKSHTVLVLASDHVIGPTESFVNDCRKAASAAGQDFFVCFAIPPLSPNTGYGYIKFGSPIGDDKTILKIDSFEEKPNLETAKQYLASGLYAWNSGMFAFKTDFFLSEVKSLAPDVYSAFDCLDGAELPAEKKLGCVNYTSDWDMMDKAYSLVPAIAVDKSVAERTKRAAAVRSSFHWDDVGSWDAFEKYFKENDEKTVEVESLNNFVYSDIPVALCGVEDLIVVIKDGKALVMKKGSSSSMREVIKAVEKAGCK